jgi:hypothetical protein
MCTIDDSSKGTSFLFYMPCPLRASKIFTLSFMLQVKQLGAASQGECIR